MTITVLGGTGLLGRKIVRQLSPENRVIVTGRSIEEGPDEMRVDLATGEGLDRALEDSEVVIHLASDPRNSRSVDVEGTKLILDRLGSRHLVYMSIVGVDRHPFPYYRNKFLAEEVIGSSGRSYSIVRATQFHGFIAFMLDKVVWPPVCFVPHGFVFQPIDAEEVATHVAEVSLGKPQGLLPDLCGPQVIGIEHLARSYMEAKGKERPVIQLPVPGQTARAFREGVHTNPDRATGLMTWERWLADNLNPG